MRFQVLVNDEPHPVELVFGRAAEITAVNRWRAPASVASRPGVRDTLEFAQLASKRWRYYRRSIATASSVENFKVLVADEPKAEISFLLVVRADWFRASRYLGLAQGRRTYWVHPAIVGGANPQVHGVGAGLLYSLAELAGLLGVPLIWGEATGFSAPFYEHTLDVAGVTDHFFIQGTTWIGAAGSSAKRLTASLDTLRKAMYSLNKMTKTKAQIVKDLKEAYACEKYFPGFLGNPVTFAARWGLPLSKSYLKFKERELRAANRRRASRTKRNGAPKTAIDFR